MRSAKSRQLAGPTKKKILISIGLVLLVLTSFFGGYFSQYALRGEGEKVVSDVLHVMDQVGFVYDPEKDEYVKLDEDKIARLIAGNFLDGYSKYYTKEEYEELQRKKKGNYTNFGISMSNSNSKSLEEDTNVVSGVVLNSPAHLAGIKAGDKIVAISVNGGEFVGVTCGLQLNDLLNSALENDQYDFYIDGQEEPITVQKKSYSRCYVTYEDSEVSAFFSPVYGQRVNSVSDAYAVIVENSKWPTDDGANDGTEDGEDGQPSDANTQDSAPVEDSQPEEPATPPEEQPTPDFDKFGDDVAYVRLTAFEGDAALQFGAVIKYMVERGRTRLVLDLAGNGGGNMTILQNIASYLIYNGGKVDTKIAVASEKLDGNATDGYVAEGYRQTSYSTTVNNFNTAITDISVIADRNTASASECLIGAMIHYKDKNQYDRYIFTKDNLVIVGSANPKNSDDGVIDGTTEYRTYGKGIMQTTYKLSSGGALKLTTAKLLWPNSSTCIHKVGITPSLNSNKAQNHDTAVTTAINMLKAKVSQTLPK